MIRVIKDKYSNRLIFQPISFTPQELGMLEEICIQYFGSINNVPPYAYLSLSIIRESLKLDMLEGVVYVDSSRIEENLKRLFGGKEK